MADAHAKRVGDGAPEHRREDVRRPEQGKLSRAAEVKGKFLVREAMGETHGQFF